MEVVLEGDPGYLVVSLTFATAVLLLFLSDGVDGLVTLGLATSPFTQ